MIIHTQTHTHTHTHTHTQTHTYRRVVHQGSFFCERELTLKVPPCDVSPCWALDAMALRELSQRSSNFSSAVIATSPCSIYICMYVTYCVCIYNVCIIYHAVYTYICSCSIYIYMYVTYYTYIIYTHTICNIHTYVYRAWYIIYTLYIHTQYVTYRHMYIRHELSSLSACRSVRV